MRSANTPWFVWIYFPTFLALWLAMAGSGLHYRFRIKPRALDNWARGLGCRIVGTYHPALMGFVWRLGFSWFGDHPPFAGTIANTQDLFRATLRDGRGEEYRCWLKVGLPWWYPQSVERCPIEASWIGLEPEPAKSKGAVEVVHPLLDREIDG